MDGRGAGEVERGGGFGLMIWLWTRAIGKGDWRKMTESEFVRLGHDIFMDSADSIRSGNRGRVGKMAPCASGDGSAQGEFSCI